MGGLVTIVVTSAGALVLYMQRRATSDWNSTDPLYDNSDGATFRRTMYEAYRVGWYKWFLVGGYMTGLALIVASAFAKVFG